MAKTSGSGGRDLEQAITVLRARIDEEFRIAERLDSKARQAFALAAGFFAVVQTVAFGSFGQGDVHSGERIVLLAAAVLAGAALVGVAHRARNSEELLPAEDIKPEAIVQWCTEAPPDDDEYVATKLVGQLALVASERDAQNRIRQRRYDAVETAARIALIAAALELVAAIVVRI